MSRLSGGDRGAGDREIRRQERKGREAGEKCEMLIILILQCLRILSKTSTQIVFDLHLTSSLSLLRLLSKQANENALGLKNRLTSSEIVNPFTVVTSYRS